ncbi:carbohydrate-binding domain-containing protein [Cohnella suwonensis]|uniref:Carbohydrate-binding domain-containing protein n=1 Tax=Cohnella suwonensis TaxID=696072 RepID=A0ABW0LT41_9BACL
MMKSKKARTLSIILLCAALMSACGNNGTNGGNAASTGVSATETAGSATGTVAAAQTASLELTGKAEFDEDDAYADWSATDATAIKLNGATATVEGAGAEVSDGTVTITSAGTYVLSGKLDDGQIVVDAKDEATVRLVLNGVEIHNDDSSAIYVKEAGKTIVSLPEGTDNVVSDGTKYVYPDATTDEPNAAVFSHDDLTINGSGKLTVQGNYNNGITSKDKLKITGGTLNVKSVDDGVMGKDLVAVQAGELTVDAGGHAIKTSNDTAGEEGFIGIAGGTFNLKSGEDALHSSGNLTIAGGEFTINAEDDGIHADLSVGIAEGTIDIAKSNEGIEAPTIEVAGGKITLVASDDGFNAASGSSETAEGEQGGQGGGGGGMGGGPESGAASTNKLTISGGYVSVDAQGDGLDANGSIEMTGGTVLVNGPTNNGNGSLDYDGAFHMSGGFLISAGSSGMVQAASDESTQAGILMTYPQAQQAGTLVHLEDGDGNEIATFAPSKTYQSVFISSPSLKKGGSYAIYSGGASSGSLANGLYDGGKYTGGTKVVAFEAASIVTWVNESGVTEARSGMGGPGGGGFGGGGGRGGRDGDGGTPPDGERPDMPNGDMPSGEPLQQPETQQQQ